MEEHQQGRKTVAKMVEAKEQYLMGNKEMLPSYPQLYEVYD